MIYWWWRNARAPRWTYSVKKKKKTQNTSFIVFVFGLGVLDHHVHFLRCRWLESLLRSGNPVLTWFCIIKFSSFHSQTYHAFLVDLSGKKEIRKENEGTYRYTLVRVGPSEPRAGRSEQTPRRGNTQDCSRTTPRCRRWNSQTRFYSSVWNWPVSRDRCS